MPSLKTFPLETLTMNVLNSSPSTTCEISEMTPALSEPGVLPKLRSFVLPLSTSPRVLLRKGIFWPSKSTPEICWNKSAALFNPERMSLVGTSRKSSKSWPATVFALTFMSVTFVTSGQVSATDAVPKSNGASNPGSTAATLKSAVKTTSSAFGFPCRLTEMSWSSGASNS